MNPNRKSPSPSRFHSHALALLPIVCSTALLLIGGCGGNNSTSSTPPPQPNPVPAIASLSPSSVTAGAAAQMLTINGTNFLSTSTVTYNNVAHPATFVRSTQLTISLSASDQATGGNYPVAVTNPAPGGGSSNAVNFTVNAATSEVQISSLSETTANPFDSLTITGTGFNQASLAISVMFIPESGAPRITVPVFLATPTTLQLAVPPILDPTSGAPMSAVVDVQVVEFSGTTTWISNPITGLQVNALPAVPTGVPTGAMTAAFIGSALNVSNSIITAGSNSTSQSNLNSALAQYSVDMGSLVSAINTITNDPTQSVTLTLANGTTVNLNANTLAVADQVVQALVSSIVNQGPIPAAAAIRKTFEQRAAAQPSSSAITCPSSVTNATTFNNNLCAVQNFFTNLTTGSPAVVQAEEKTLIGLLMTGVATVALPEGLVLEIGASVVTSYITSYVATASTPAGTDVAGDLGVDFLDHAVEAAGGAPVIGAALDMFDVLKAAAALAPPQKGVLLTSGFAAAIPGGGTAVTFPDSNGNPTATLVQIPANAPQEVVDTTQLLIPPQPTFTLTVSLAGGGAGSVISFPEGISCGSICSATFPQGSIVGLTAVQNTGSAFQNWSGACSGTGTCSVTMNASETVTATFVTSTNETWVGTITETEGLGSAFGCLQQGSWSDNFQIVLTIPGDLVATLQSSSSAFLDGSGTLSGTQTVATQVSASCGALFPSSFASLPVDVSVSSPGTSFTPAGPTPTPLGAITVTPGLQVQTLPPWFCHSDGSPTSTELCGFFPGINIFITSISASPTAVVGTYLDPEGGPGTFSFVKQ